MIGEKTAAAWMLSFFSLPIWMALLVIFGSTGNLATIYLWIMAVDVLVFLVASVGACIQLLRSK